jgi:ubiquinone/menaquinone biosynthesis C-methylase UbiE
MSGTSWGAVADWYDRLLADPDSYQSQVVLPGLLRLIENDGKLDKNDKFIDLACGQGFFSKAYLAAGAGEVVGSDISPELIDLARASVVGNKNISFHVASAHKQEFAKTGYFTRASIILALDNIRELPEAVAELTRVLVRGGRLYIVINHPAFRVIGGSSWGYDERKHVQYRRLEAYMSESSKKVVMNPGKTTEDGVGAGVTTTTFHRPMSTYVGALAQAGFAVTNMAEWVSHKKSERGPRSKAEDKARKEFPLFLAMSARKL